jgi:hypothetical protein
MQRRQPDERVNPTNLGMMTLNGNRFVINLRPGVPWNACVEEFRNKLRCWASHAWLDQEAADVVDEYATKTENGNFVWNDNIERGPIACVKAGHSLYKMIVP